MKTRAIRSERIDFRVTQDFKHKVAAASAAYGVSVSTFISMSAMERAERVLAEREAVMLNNAMRERFMEALSRPARPAPESVQRAQKRYTQVVVSNRG